MTEKTSDTSNTESGAYVRVGANLRQARESAGLDLKAVSRQLHLSSTIIEDIEQGRVERLSSIYRRGYIANYARMLGLDPAELLAEVQGDEPPQLRQVLPVHQPGWKFERYLKIATYVLVTTVIVPPLLYFFIQGGSRIMEREPTAQLDEVVAGEQGTAGPRNERGRIARALALDESDGSGETERPGHVSASTIPLSAVRVGRDPGQAGDRDAAEMLMPAAELTSIEAAAEHDGQVELSIELMEDSWVEIHDAKGSRLEYDLLRSGVTRSYRGEPPFQMLLGRANAVQLTLDGERVVYDGHDRGDVARFRLMAGGEVER